MNYTQKLNIRNQLIQLLVDDFDFQAPQHLSIEEIAKEIDKYIDYSFNFEDDKAKEIAGDYEDFFIIASDTLCKLNLIHLEETAENE